MDGWPGMQFVSRDSTEPKRCSFSVVYLATTDLATRVPPCEVLSHRRVGRHQRKACIPGTAYRYFGCSMPAGGQHGR
jgi:hypothetical protein